MGYRPLQLVHHMSADREQNEGAGRLVLRIYISHSEFFIYDADVKYPRCKWAEGHVRQGFARRDSEIAVGALIEYGYAEVVVVYQPYSFRVEYERVITVPFRVTSGVVLIEGPEDESDRRIDCPVGDYRLTVAQFSLDEEAEVIHLFFEPVASPIEQSSILIADKALDPTAPLIETCEILDG